MCSSQQGTCRCSLFNLAGLGEEQVTSQTLFSQHTACSHRYTQTTIQKVSGEQLHPPVFHSTASPFTRTTLFLFHSRHDMVDFILAHMAGKGKWPPVCPYVLNLLICHPCLGHCRGWLLQNSTASQYIMASSTIHPLNSMSLSVPLKILGFRGYLIVSLPIVDHSLLGHPTFYGFINLLKPGFKMSPQNSAYMAYTRNIFILFYRKGY